jgi:hypothetical protein
MEGLVLTGNTGKYDGWRRLRDKGLLKKMLVDNKLNSSLSKETQSFSYGKGRVINLSALIQSAGLVKLGFESIWLMPENANELESAVYWAAGKRLSLQIKAPEWVGVSHDSQENREVIHLFNYKNGPNAGGITLEYNGKVKKAWAVSPDEEGEKTISFAEEGNITVLRISDLKYYSIIVLEK